jgi:UDP-N-acetylmuramate--alanine ligase
VFGRITRFHFIGIGGSGMSGIAELLARRGFTVTGSDLVSSETTARLKTMGITVHEGHDASHVGQAQAVVYSSAVRPTNPEWQEAAARALPLVPRGEMLAELMKGRYGIAVAGAHGKTTTTSMIAVALERGGLDPTAVIGARLRSFGSSVRAGGGDYMVVEADESDRSFLKLSPALAVITNIDYEHMESYRTFADLVDAFVTFADRTPFYGGVVLCADDPNLGAVRERVRRRVITYSLTSDRADVFARDVRLESFGASCTAWGRAGASAGPLGPIRLRVPGRHNLQNALAAVAVGKELGVEFSQIAAALEAFAGADRRFERRGEANGVVVVDDYGHHPTEIAAVLAAARSATTGRVIVAFQPHRFTRTLSLMSEFGPAFAGADEVVLTDIYSAGEDAIPGVTIERLGEALRSTGRSVHVVPRLDAVPAALAGLARPGDLVITLGAGTIGTLPERVLEALGGKG